MNLDRKLEIAKQAVASITRHDDESLEQREATLRALAEYAASESKAAQARESAKAKQ